MADKMEASSFRYNLFIIIFFLYILFIYFPASAVEITKVVLIGSSLEIIHNQIHDIKGDFDNNEIKAIGIKVTDEYHRLGFSTSYVDKLVVSGKGILEIYIIESKILGVNVTDIEGNDREIERAVLSWKGELYNRFILEQNAENLKRRFNLSSVKIYPVNYKDSGDVFLSVKVKKKSRGKFYGSIGVEPVYGITPELGYYYPFTDTAVDLFSRIGYREGEVRRAEGDIKYFIFFGDSSSGIYAGANITRLINRWESMDIDYISLSLYPALGFRSIYGYLLLDISLKEIVTDIKDYGRKDENFRDYDTRLTVDLDISNKVEVLSVHEETGLKVILSCGRDDLNEDGYFNFSADIQTSFSPIIWMRFIPSFYSYYTTSEERFFWDYVFDRHLLGFYDDFTSSKWKNTGGLDIEFEISPRFIYIGPFINTGYFLNEPDEWTSETGGGAKAAIMYRDIQIEIYYAWDLSKSPSEGGLSVLIGGKF